MRRTHRGTNTSPDTGPCGEKGGGKAPTICYAFLSPQRRNMVYGVLGRVGHHVCVDRRRL